VRFPRLTIRTLIVIVAILGVDFAAIREPTGEFHYAHYDGESDALSVFAEEPFDMCVYCSLPMANGLAICLHLAISQRGRVGPFLKGFGIAGLAATAATLIGCLMRTSEAFQLVGRASRWLWWQTMIPDHSYTGPFRAYKWPDFVSYLGPALSFLYVVAAPALIQLVIALAGGRIARRPKFHQTNRPN